VRRRENNKPPNRHYPLTNKVIERVYGVRGSAEKELEKGRDCGKKERKNGRWRFIP